MPTSLTKMVYANGDPVNLNDPTGCEGDAISTTAAMSGIAALASSFMGALPEVEAVYHIVMAASFSMGAYLIKDNWALIRSYVGSGVAGAAAIAGVLAANPWTIQRAIEQAMSAAIATTTAAALSKLRMFPIYKGIMPDIYNFDVACLNTHPQWYVLSYNGPYSQRTRDNRAWVNLNFASLRIGHPFPEVLDEFPFASTAQGGQYGPAKGCMVPWLENCVQGGLLGAFYRWTLESKPNDFLVVPIPL